MSYTEVASSNCSGSTGKSCLFVIPRRSQGSFLSSPRAKMRRLFLSVHLPTSLLHFLQRSVSSPCPFFPTCVPYFRTKQQLPYPIPLLPPKPTKETPVLSSDLLYTAALGHHVCPQNPLKGCKAQATTAFLTQGVKMGGDQPGRSPTQVPVHLPCLRKG